MQGELVWRFAWSRRLLLALVLPLAACAPLAPPVVDTALALRWQPSPNVDARRPNYVVLHATSNDTAEQALATLSNAAKKVSAHYLIARDGTLHQLVAERNRAWHAGESYWGGLTDLNSASIGIELDNNGEEPFPAVQINVLLELMADIKRRHGIPAANFVGHGDIAPRRKVDPGHFFPWKRLAGQGFGLWCDAPSAAPAAFDARLGLQALGYELVDRAATVRAYRRHYAADDTTAELAESDKAMLHCLVRLKAGG